MRVISFCTALLIILCVAISSLAVQPCQQCSFRFIQSTAVDRFGDMLPSGAVVRFGTIRWRHSASIVYAAMTPDETKVVTAGDDNKIITWAYPSGRRLLEIDLNTIYKQFPPLNYQTYWWRGPRVALSANGKIVAINGGRIGYVLDAATGRPLGIVKADTQNGPYPMAIAISPDSRLMAVAYEDRSIALVDIPAFVEKKRIRLNKRTDNSSVNGPILGTCEFSPDGKHLAVYQEIISTPRTRHSLCVLDLETEQVKLQINGDEKKDVLSPVFSPNSRLVAFTDLDGSVWCSEIDSGKPSSKIMARPSKSDHCLASVQFGDNSTLYVKDIGTTRLRRLRIENVSFTKEYLCDFGPRADIAFYTSLVRTNNSVFALSPRRDKALLFADNNAVHFLDLLTGKTTDSMAAASSSIRHVAYSSDGSSQTTITDRGTLNVWSTSSGQLLHTRVTGVGVRGRVLTPDGRVYASYSEDGLAIRLEDLHTGKYIGQVPIPTNGNGDLDDVRLAALADTGDRIAVLWEHLNQIDVFDILAGRRICTINQERYTRGQKRVLPQPRDVLVFSHDGKLLGANAGLEGFAVWAIPSTKVLLFHKMVSAPIDGRFSRDSRSLALNTGVGQIILIELATGHIRAKLWENSDRLPIDTQASAFERNGTTKMDFIEGMRSLASVGLDGRLRIWCLADSKLLATVRGHTGPVSAMAVDPKGASITTGSTDTTGLVWDLRHSYQKN